MDRNWLCLFCFCSVLLPSRAQAQSSAVQTSFKVKYVAEEAVYLDAGRNAGLAIGQKLTVRREASEQSQKTLEIVAELQVVSVASSSSVCEVVSSNLEIKVGDLAHLSPHDIEILKILNSSTEVRKYPQVVTFNEGDPLEEEARASVPRPPLPEINRARGRLGFEYNSIQDRGTSSLSSSQLGFVLRMDMTRLGGSYWNFGGYYRGRINSRTSGKGQETLTDLINRTYHVSLSYNNPNSRWVAGAGRLNLPWASSLDTIDGGYLGRRYGKAVTYGVFGGSSPDPTSWKYDPHRQMAGGFVNAEGGSFDSLRYSSTFGVALTRVRWRPDRQFGFVENSIFYKRYFSIYHNLEADLLRAAQKLDSKGLVASRSYLTIRIQPHRILSFDLSQNYFRDIPSFDIRLVSAGLVDKLLFQGLSGGFRLELPRHVSVYTSLGRSNKTGDTRNSWNQLYGATWSRIWRTGLRADIRYSKFDSTFGSGSYRSLSLGRELGERLRFEIQAGEQSVFSTFTLQSNSRWLTSNADWFLGLHYFVGIGYTVYRGNAQSYNQWFLNLGYRF